MNLRAAQGAPSNDPVSRMASSSTVGTGGHDADDSKRPHRQCRQGAAPLAADARTMTSADGPSFPAFRRARALHASGRQSRLRGATHRESLLDCGAAGSDRASAPASVPPGAVHHVHRRLEPHTTRRESAADESGTGRRGAEARASTSQEPAADRRDHEHVGGAFFAARGVMVDEATGVVAAAPASRRRAPGRADCRR